MTSDISRLSKFVEAISSNFPERKHLVPTLADVLNLNIKTMRKKLKGESPFNFDEIVTLCREYDLDFNKIAKGPLPYHPLKLFTPNWSDIPTSRKDPDMFLDMYRQGAEGGNSEVMIATNSYPKFVLSQCRYLNKIDWLAYRYYNDRSFKIVPGEFKELTLDNSFNIKMIDLLSAYNKFSCILSVHMMSNVAELLTYFYRINLLDGEDIRLLIEDCENFMDWLQSVCDKGTFENGHPAEIMISELSLSTDFNVISSDRFKWASIQHHFDYIILIDDPETIDIPKEWFASGKKTSTNISGLAELARNSFFNRQRKDLRERLSDIIQ